MTPVKRKFGLTVAYVTLESIGFLCFGAGFLGGLVKHSDTSIRVFVFLSSYADYAFLCALIFILSGGLFECLALRDKENGRDLDTNTDTARK